MTWTRFTATADYPFDGYRTDGAEVTDNGDGFGSSRNSGRWAVTVRGRWVANVDTLALAKQCAEGELRLPRLTTDDLKFVRQHARDYAAVSPSWGHMADDYATWYVDRFCDREAEMADLPSHSTAWTQWLADIGAVS